MVAHSVQLATREEEVYRGRVNNLSQAPHVLGLIREKFNEAELRAFEVTCFNYLQGVDELTFSGQLMHELSLRRVGNQGVKDPKGADPFNRLRSDQPHDIEVEPQRIRLLREYFPQKVGLIGESSKTKAVLKKVSKKIFVTCAELERAFKEAKNNIAVNLDYLDLMDEMDREVKVELRGMVREMRRRKKKKLGEQRRCNGLDGVAKDFVICVAFIGNIGFINVSEFQLLTNTCRFGQKKIPKLEKPLCYCKMVDLTATPRILRWKTTKKQPIHE
ncbi:hypothetical protein DVH24_001395 [Malus domestica]|uniref:Uncharacterized protein n=1 Tax=Malus domestica TaxID=3750 RepID=A0A498K0M8_MALDO|nr:hypothetical protein DVH24_001395 [Malus domestica]